MLSIRASAVSGYAKIINRRYTVTIMSQSVYFLEKTQKNPWQKMSKPKVVSDSDHSDKVPADAVKMDSPAKRLASEIKKRVKRFDEPITDLTDVGVGSRTRQQKRAHVSVAYEQLPTDADDKKQIKRGRIIEAEASDPTSTDQSKEIAPKAMAKKKSISPRVPPGWKLQYENILEMRKCRDAPVDSMGCERIADVNESPKVFRYQTLLALMMSSQTKDEVTSAAMSRLQAHGCTIDHILKTSDKQLGELISPVGFWKRKAEYIKKTSLILKEKYDYDIPDNIEELCQLPGVGPKMSYLTMTCAWDKCVGIGVDVHVHRISNRLGWVMTSKPEQTREALEGWLPRDYWKEVNYIFVGFGQQTCKPLYPMCATCLNKDICPHGKKELKHKKKK
ncbi:endonuclease III-like protein 1 [Lineus longissimus]|uniref:endonuclease III-like protein 1 n=1 Tax=Lineus longissimus TaxID=88925 RepID=UPI002B4C9080